MRCSSTATTATPRRILRGFAGSFAPGWVGRRYHRLLTAAGFSDVEVHAETVVRTDHEAYGFMVSLLVRTAIASDAVGADEGEAWQADPERRGAEGTWFMSMTHFIAVARRGDPSDG